MEKCNKALILAAGLGTRLAPLTDDKPKSLVSVNGVPIICKQLENLFINHISDITIVSGYAFTVPKRNRHSQIVELSGRIASAMISFKYHTTEQALDEREKLYRSVPKSSLIANYGGAWGKKEIVPAEWYGKGAEAEFEGLTVQLPSAYCKWLTQVYGDYLQLPSPEKRVPHHYAEVIDPEKPYTSYMQKGKP